MVTFEGDLNPAELGVLDRDGGLESSCPGGQLDPSGTSFHTSVAMKVMLLCDFGGTCGDTFLDDMLNCWQVALGPPPGGPGGLDDATAFTAGCCVVWADPGADPIGDWWLGDPLGEGVSTIGLAPRMCPERAACLSSSCSVEGVGV